MQDELLRIGVSERPLREKVQHKPLGVALEKSPVADRSGQRDLHRRIGDGPLTGMTGKESPFGVQKAATISETPSRDVKSETKPENLKLNECKRVPPPSNKGNGTSRRFVPWDKKC